MNIAVIGTGYVGIVTGVCLADSGNQVMCVDIDSSKVDKLNRGDLFLYEPGLLPIFKRNLKEKRITFTTSLEQAIENSDIIFLALPTPPNENGSSDLSYVLKVANNIGKIIKSYKIVVNKSTVPVGTSEKVKEEICKHYKGKIDVVSNPEFLREGSAVLDFTKPNRIIIGTSFPRVAKLMQELYSPFVHQGNTIMIMDERSSELTKYAANAFLATKVSFMNEMSVLCEKVGANVDLIRRGIGLDQRIGNSFLYAGLGYGGSCFPKDIQACRHMGVEYDTRLHIIEAVYQANQRQIQFFIDKINAYFDKLQGKKMAIWGLSFKPNTDDIRESPSLKIVDYLLKEGVQLAVYDAEAMKHVQEKYGEKLIYASSFMQSVEGMDALVIATEWREFSLPNYRKLKESMRQAVIFDGRNIFALNRMSEEGFDYFSVGRKPILNYTGT